jgi:RHS repeat-associated protein
LQGTFLNSPQYDAGIWNSSGLTGRATSFDPRRQATAGPIDTISSFRTRQYDPATGKWLQEDHAGLAGGVNLYEYNGNDPNSFRDPFGLCNPPGSCVLAGIATGGALGAAVGVTVNSAAAIGTAGVSLIQAPASTALTTAVGAAIGGTLGAVKEVADAAPSLVRHATVAMASLKTWAKRLFTGAAIYLGGGVPERAKHATEPPEVEQPANAPKRDLKQPDSEDQPQ